MIYCNKLLFSNFYPFCLSNSLHFDKQRPMHYNYIPISDWQKLFFWVHFTGMDECSEWFEGIREYGEYVEQLLNLTMAKGTVKVAKQIAFY